MTTMPRNPGSFLNIDDLAIVINQTAREHGFWDNPRNLGEMLMLTCSELAEALEEDRAGRPHVWFAHKPGCKLAEDFIAGRVTKEFLTESRQGDHGCTCHPKPEGTLVEVIDAIIRLLDTGQDMAGRTQYSLGEVMSMKMLYNESREHMHGKAY
jgi:hypothetical protein